MSKEDRSDYFKRYYKENREDIIRKRREQYASDSDYAESVKRNIEESRKRSSKGKQRRKKIPYPVYKNEIFVGDGYTLWIVAERTGKPLHVLRHWIKVGLMPQSPFKTESGRVLYTEDMADVVADAVRKRKGAQIRKGNNRFKREIEEGWRLIGLLEE